MSLLSVTEQENLAKRLSEFKEKQKERAEKILHDDFPARVLLLNDLLQGGKFDYSHMEEVMVDVNVPYVDELVSNYGASAAGTSAPKKIRLEGPENGFVNGTRVYTCISGTISSNAGMSDLIDTLKPLLRDAVEHVNAVKLWLLLLIPRMEDGNNFGVSIQEEVLSETRSVESEAAAFLDTVSRYFVSRAQLVSKLAKYPHVEDYRNAIRDMDEKQFINLRLVIVELRNHYATLHDLIMKNYEKLKKPRNNNTESMY